MNKWGSWTLTSILADWKYIWLLPRRRCHPTPVLSHGKSQGQGSLLGCSPWGRWESDITERLHFPFHALEKEMATHSSILAWRISGQGSLVGCCLWGHTVGHNWSDLAARCSKKQESSRKTSLSALLTMPKALTVWITRNCGKFWNKWEYQTTWPASWETYMQVRKQQLELDMEQQTGSK